MRALRAVLHWRYTRLFSAFRSYRTATPEKGDACLVLQTKVGIYYTTPTESLELCNVGPSRYIYKARHVALVISLVTTITRYNALLHNSSDILPTSLLLALSRVTQDTAAASVAY
jgi:hypothetical protein